MVRTNKDTDHRPLPKAFRVTPARGLAWLVSEEHFMSGDQHHRIHFHLATRNSFKRLGFLFLLLGAGLGIGYITMIRMPGKSFSGPLPALTASQESLAQELHRDVDMLADQIGPRCLEYPDALQQSVEFIERSLTDLGLTVERQTFEVHGQKCHNLIAEIKGSTLPEEVVVVGAHYDSCFETPAANDNGSGVAATLALARRFAPTAAAGKGLDRTLRFVLFVNEEPPYFQTEDMGSLVYARACRAKNENIVAMLSLETIGYYSDEPGSQRYPIKPIGWLYPDTGELHHVRRQLQFARSGPPVHRLVSHQRPVSLRRSRTSQLDQRRRLVRPVGVLASWLSRCDGYRHSSLPISALSRGHRHARQARLPPHGPRGGGARIGRARARFDESIEVKTTGSGAFRTFRAGLHVQQSPKKR